MTSLLLASRVLGQLRKEMTPAIFGAFFSYWHVFKKKKEKQGVSWN